MAWITDSEITRELGRLTSENHAEVDVKLAITEATAEAEGYLRAVVNDNAILASWDTAETAPTDIVLIVSRLGASIILSRFYGQSLIRRQGDPPSRAADLRKLAIDELMLYAKGLKRLVDRATDDEIAVEASLRRSGTNTTRKFDIGTDSDPKKLDRL